ncbi:LADA_0D04324g1_1 [Lachancea dasiensis]|uniref:LADA_0D04324g1_1 n=1 Tax=Lachancea dasiensis TaxID=1072105 RepID=A0A1G4J4X8_9SACH|nr:LADA_0D04324g1_1 [Lachancea dasiensis]
MSSLQDQLNERKKRLELLASKGLRTGTLSDDTRKTQDRAIAEAEIVGAESNSSSPFVSLHDTPHRDSSEKAPNKPNENSRDENSEKVATMIKPTSDLQKKLQPDLDELENRTQEAIKRLVRQRLLTESSTVEDT